MFHKINIFYVLYAVSGSYANADIVRIALVDTGVNTARLTQNIQSKVRMDLGANIFDGPIGAANTSLVDEDGHGTKIAQIILDRCPQCELVPIKVTKHGAGIRPSDLVEALKSAKKSGVKIVNMSIGLSGDSKEMREAFKKAESDGMIIVTAAGSGLSNPFKARSLKDIYPQSYSSVIVVGVSSKSEHPVNYGPELDVVISDSIFQKSDKVTSISSSQMTGVLVGWIGKYFQDKSRSDVLVKENLGKTLDRLTNRPASIRHAVRSASVQNNAFFENDESKGAFGLLTSKELESGLGIGDLKLVAYTYSKSKSQRNVELSAHNEIKKISSKMEGPCTVKSVDFEIRKKGRATIKLSNLQMSNPCKLVINAEFEDHTKDSVTVTLDEKNAHKTGPN